MIRDGREYIPAPSSSPQIDRMYHQIKDYENRIEGSWRVLVGFSKQDPFGRAALRLYGDSFLGPGLVAQVLTSLLVDLESELRDIAANAADSVSLYAQLSWETLPLYPTFNLMVLIWWYLEVC